MFTLSGPVAPADSRIEIKVGDSGFVLIVRPVTDDERTTDSALNAKHWGEDDPKVVGKWYIAREQLRRACVVDWEGVSDPSGNPIPFSQASFSRLLAVPGVRDQVIDPVNRHFEGRVADAVLGESGSRPSDSSADETERSKESSTGTQGASPQAN